MIENTDIIGGSNPITNFVTLNNSSYFVLPEGFDYATDLIITVPDGVYLFRYWWLIILMVFAMFYIGTKISPYILKFMRKEE